MTAAPQHQPTDPLWRRCWSSLRWWVRGVTGADAYDKYLEWCRRTRHEPMAEKAFWRDQCDRQDRNPQARCCWPPLTDTLPIGPITGGRGR
ncbi:hypothetical protein CUAC110533_06110 [Cutibacterium acnes subsp. elongatum]|nr:hypothetical protein AK828_11630 [Cutibacterium acnes]KPG67658.1 hypothetical protein AK827_00690 [Cutibacterium acnes]PZA02523.1 DUF466 domain-containing protein [Cutibacterium acnes]